MNPLQPYPIETKEGTTMTKSRALATQVIRKRTLPAFPLALLLALTMAAGARAEGAAAAPAGVLDAAGVLKAGACTPSATVLCLDNNRFRVAVSWRQAGGASGNGSVVSGSTSDSGLFWFFNPANYEMMVKVLDGCAVNGKHWVFFLATTNVGFTLTVTDTVSQTTKTYGNTAGTVPPVVTDTSAFGTCP